MGGLVMRAYVLALSAALSGCTVSELVMSGPGPAPDLSQPDHRRIVAENIGKVLGSIGSSNSASLGVVEISGVRQVHHLTGPAWLTCLKLDAERNPQLYAIFIQDGKIADTRIGVLIDQCSKQEYTRFEIAEPATKRTKSGERK
jgi:hypothetical protein